MSLLDRIEGYKDIGKLSPEELTELARDIRGHIVSVVLTNGGHLASSLGTVELTLSLLRSFDPEVDRIVFDVGHQTYAYKILTGRKDAFATLRRSGGISGFPKRRESPFDHFDTGHSSTSLSAVLGYAKARDMLGQKHHTVAVIGDAALLNGLSFEALNYTKDAGTKVIYVLNDNTMSISPRIGGFATHLARLSANSTYNWLKKAIKDSCSSFPRGEVVENLLSRIKDHLKSIVRLPTIFDEMGINYWGPFDGHNVQELDGVFELAKRYDRPVLLHVVTVKGKGWREAEENPTGYHGVSPRRESPCTEAAPRTWSDSAALGALRLAEEDRRVVCLTAAMKCGCKLEAFADRFPDRIFDVGIEEGHMVTMAAGMAAGGLRPIVFIYSTFLQRAMDQLVHDVALQNLPVLFAVDRAGFVGEDGETHQGLFDIPWCRAVPNLTVAAPRDERTLEALFRFALHQGTPALLRFPRGEAPAEIPGVEGTSRTSPLEPEILTKGTEWILFGYGGGVPLALEARALAERSNLPVPTVVDLACIQPFPARTLRAMLEGHSFAVAVEEGYAAGGIGEALSAFAQTMDHPCRVSCAGVPARFVPQGTVEEQRRACALTPEGIVERYVRHAAGTDRQTTGL